MSTFSLGKITKILDDGSFKVEIEYEEGEVSDNMTTKYVDEVMEHPKGDRVIFADMVDM